MIVKDILFYFMCEYYLVFFYGKVYIVYLLNDGCVIGFSKFVCVVEVVSKCF